MKIVAVIPAYNEATHVGAVVSLAREYVDEVIVVDDGSRDTSAEEARDAGATVYRHAVNRGLGGSIATGLKAAQICGADVIVTLDADGQHDPGDIERLIAPIVACEADFVIGSRLIDPQGMPLTRRLANRAANTITAALFGVKVTDSQSGFRALSREVAQTIEIRTSRMEVSSEMVVEVAKHRFRIAEVPISVLYSEYSLSKGQSFKVGVETLVKLAMRKAA